MKSRLDIIKTLIPNTGIGVEVGVHAGSFSFEILENWGGILYSVDSWKHFPDKHQDLSNVSDEEHEKYYQITKDKLKQFGKRSIILRKESLIAASDFEDQSLDFVYIDAQHDYRSVIKDLTAWNSKVKVGGVMAGHDYFNTNKYRKNLVEVKRAVDDFFEIPVFSTNEKRLPSWYVIKN